MKRTKLFAILTAVMIIILSVSPLAFAKDCGINDENGDIVGISNRGLWHSYPENSLEAVLKAAETGIDAVLVDISVSKDGVPVLLERSSASRMLNNAEKENVNEYTLSEIQSFYLKNSSGGKNNEVTEYKVCTLAQALENAAQNNIYLVLKTDASDFDAVIKASENYADFTVYLTGEQDSVKQILKEHGNEYSILTEKRGNIVFLQTAFIDYCAENSAAGTVLKTTNRYGVNFNQTVLKHFYGNSRAVADTSNSTLAGAREDTEKWWNDLVSRGYSVIITNDAESFVKYKKENADARENLQNAYTKYTENWTLPQFGSIVFNDYKKAYTDAISEAEKLLADKSSSTQDMNDCRTALIKACDDIDLNYEALEQGKAGMTVSAPRICLCIGAVIVVVAVQIFFFRRREKN